MCAHDDLCLISAGAIEDCGNTGILQIPSNYDFKNLKTYSQAESLCSHSGLELPGHSGGMGSCLRNFRNRMRDRIGFKHLPVLFIKHNEHHDDPKHHVVCLVRKFNQAMLLWECVHGKPIDPVWHDGSVYVTLHIILTVFYQQFIINLDLIQSHDDWSDTELIIIVCNWMNT